MKRPGGRRRSGERLQRRWPAGDGGVASLARDGVCVCAGVVVVISAEHSIPRAGGGVTMTTTKEADFVFV